MTVTTKLTEKDYINASFTIMSLRPIFRLYVPIIFLILIINILTNSSTGGMSIAAVIPPILIFSIFGTVIYISIKRGYSRNNRLGETIEYTFDEKNLIIHGESFNSELSWNKIPKVTKTKRWVLIWQSRQIANVIPTQNISESDLSELKNILAINRVKNNL